MEQDRWADRDDQIEALYTSGKWTMAALGDYYDISHQRVQQILKRRDREGKRDG